RGPELGDALHRVEPGVEGDGSRDVAACGEPGRVRHHHGVARPRAPLEVGDDERLETGRVDDTPLLHVRLEAERMDEAAGGEETIGDRKSTRLNSSHVAISYAVFCLKKKNRTSTPQLPYGVREGPVGAARV